MTTERSKKNPPGHDDELRDLGVDPDQIVDERDVKYMLGAPSPGERQAVVCALTTYRYPDTLKEGDAAPDLELYRLASEDRVRLPELAGERPVMLIFGSYT